MPRRFRIVVPSLPHHVIQRGNRRQAVFFYPGDKTAYLKILKEQAQKHHVRIWAYCLMDNHVHLILVPQDDQGLAKAVAETHRRFTCKINLRNKWRGYLWQGRFLSSVMDNIYLTRTLHYVENNPVRAGMVAHAWEYAWSSARAHISGRPDPVLDPLPPNLPIRDWKAFLLTPSTQNALDEIRKRNRAGLPIGEKSFLQSLAQRFGMDEADLNLRARGPTPENLMCPGYGYDNISAMSEIQCPHCQNPIYDSDALLCHFCGNSLNRRSGSLMGAMRSGGMKWIMITIAVIVVLAFLLTSFNF